MSLKTAYGGSGSSSGTPEVDTLHGYLKYNPITDRIEASKAIGTTIHSLYFGDIHSMSSIATNVMWTNQEDKTNYQAVGTSFGAHSQEGGKWVDSHPTFRKYGDYYSRDVGVINPDVNSSIDYNDVNIPMSVTAANMGHTWIAAEDYVGMLKYQVRFSGSQRLVVNRSYLVNVSKGDTHQQLFDIPVDLYQGMVMDFTLTKVDNSFMKVRPNLSGGYFIKVHGREFVDAAVSIQQSTTDFEMTIAAGLPALFPVTSLAYPELGFILMEDSIGKLHNISWP